MTPRLASIFSAARRWPAKEVLPAQIDLEILHAVEHWISGSLTEAAESVLYLRRYYQLPAKPQEILHGKVPLGRLGNQVLELVSYPKLLSLTPFGFWPEPLAATAAALRDGAEAMDEILAWLYLARLIYGYTWRVLVDWRYFEQVREHPRFQAFLQEEDELVEKIEAAIDRGEYPL